MKRHIIPIATLLLLAAVSRAQTPDATPVAGSETPAPTVGQDAPAAEAPASADAPNPALAAAVAAAAAAPAAPAAPADSTVRFKNFQVIAEKNIFNANRRGRTTFNTRNIKRTQVDTFALLGTMSYEKGQFAFFGGSGSSYRKTLKPADQIAGYTVSDIGYDRVKLTTTNGEPVELCIGMQMRRVDGGAWALSGRMEVASALADTSSAASEVLSTADDSTEVEESPNDDATTKALKRLMKKRKKELSK